MRRPKHKNKWDSWDEKKNNLYSDYMQTETQSNEDKYAARTINLRRKTTIRTHRLQTKFYFLLPSLPNWNKDTLSLWLRVVDNVHELIALFYSFTFGSGSSLWLFAQRSDLPPHARNSGDHAKTQSCCEPRGVRHYPPPRPSSTPDRPGSPQEKSSCHRIFPQVVQLNNK